MKITNAYLTGGTFALIVAGAITLSPVVCTMAVAWATGALAVTIYDIRRSRR